MVSGRLTDSSIMSTVVPVEMAALNCPRSTPFMSTSTMPEM